MTNARYKRRIEQCDDDDRRVSNRLPIQQAIRYRLLLPKNTPELAGCGKTLNMSSGGVLFTTESDLPAGARAEVTISWPVQLDNAIPLKLVVVGELVRCDTKQAAISIERYEFKTRGSRFAAA